MINDNILNCTRCSHEWKSKVKHLPKRCPNCKSPYWNRPREKVSKDLVISLKKLTISMHELIILKSGGLGGVRDDGGLYFTCFALVNCMNKQKQDPLQVGAFAYNEFAKKHHFKDGNKRIAHVMARTLLLTSGYHMKLDYKEAIPFILEIAKANSKVKIPEIRKWLKSNSIKLKSRKEIATFLKDAVLFDMVNNGDKQ